MTTNKEEKTFGDDVRETAYSVIGGLIFGGAGSEIGRFISRYDKQLIAYWMSGSNPKPDPDSATEDRGVPPFVVVGLGRCGCHVSAELAEIISSRSPSAPPMGNLAKSESWINKLFRKPDSGSVLKFEPVMLVGDIDETAFDEVDGLLDKGGVPSDVARQFLKLNYQPLAEGGVGHVPIFAEFLTKALLLLPPLAEEDSPTWNSARQFLTSFNTDSNQVPRLVFYLFSAGGGTGAGSAAEIMRAQSFARNLASIDREIYFTGAAILPQDIEKDQRRLINTGRTICQYLADMNITLESADAYDQSPDCRSASFIETHPPGDESKVEAHAIRPWNGLALISNNVMAAAAEDPLNFEDVESNANQYIAQQIFNLAAAQFPAAEFEKDVDESSITKKNYQAIRLDPNDLKNGLVGPYAIAFGAASMEVMSGDDLSTLDSMFIRSIGLPSYYQEGGRDSSQLIQGISIAPTTTNSYSKLCNALFEYLSNSDTLLDKNAFEPLSKLPFFRKCPRIVYSLTAPQRGNIPVRYKDRLQELTSWLFPNLIQTRTAISWGTTSFFSLSIYIETSPLLAPDVQLSIVNYLRLCWRQRRLSTEEFVAQYKQFVDQDPPLSDQHVEEWLGKQENYGVNIPNFDHISDEYNRKWRRYVDTRCEDEIRKIELAKHTIDATLLTYKEVASALRYINYAGHLQKPPTTTAEDLGDIF